MRILLVEDERDIAEPLAEMLRIQRYDVTWAPDASSARKALEDRDFDVAVFDVMLPEAQDAGFELVGSLRDVGFRGGILLVTARDSVADRIRGLDLGADDYLVKPFSFHEFLARVRALARRSAQTRRSVLRRGLLEVDFGRRSVRWRGEGRTLSDREFAMIELFAHYPDRVFGPSELQERFFPDARSGVQVVRVYVKQLREKIHPGVIETVSGGYVLGASDAA